MTKINRKKRRQRLTSNGPRIWGELQQKKNAEWVALQKEKDPTFETHEEYLTRIQREASENRMRWERFGLWFNL